MTTVEARVSRRRSQWMSRIRRPVRAEQTAQRGRVTLGTGVISTIARFVEAMLTPVTVVNAAGAS